MGLTKSKDSETWLSKVSPTADFHFAINLSSGMGSSWSERVRNDAAGTSYTWDMG
jgi:hypothetical protein